MVMKKTVEEKINRIDSSKRLNKKIERKYDRVENKISKAKSNTEKLKKIDRKYGYNYEAAIKSGLTPDSSGHWGSIDPSTGMILKGKKHPSIMKTKKIERVLGNKIVKKDGERYSIPKKK
jgi:hypothetical protein